MKRKLYPDRGRDRFSFWVSILSVLFCTLTLILGDYGWTVFFAILTVFNVSLAYFFQDQMINGGSGEYTAVISDIRGIEKQLSKLSEFLDRERERVSDTENTIRKLQNEKEKLEPIVSAKRETVEAIIAAHSQRIRSNVWKERLIGFGMGILASVIASIVYGYFNP